MRLHASRKGFCDRAVEIVYQSLLCDLGSMLEARGLDSLQQVATKVGPAIMFVMSSGHTTSKRSNTVRISSSISSPSRIACRGK
jgi:hypothetical protein